MLGPGCTGFLLFMSLWGTIFMAVLGGLYYNQSVGLLEDLPDESAGWGERPWEKRKDEIVKQFNQNAYNAWVAGAVYAGCALLLSFRACCLCRR